MKRGEKRSLNAIVDFIFERVSQSGCVKKRVHEYHLWCGNRSNTL